METIRLTTAEAIVRYLIAQKSAMLDGVAFGRDNAVEPLFPGVFAIFGHGNVTCLGHALEQHQDDLPTWRGQNGPLYTSDAADDLTRVGLRGPRLIDKQTDITDRLCTR